MIFNEVSLNSNFKAYGNLQHLRNCIHMQIKYEHCKKIIFFKLYTIFHHL